MIEPKIINSPLGGRVTEGGVTVDVQIVRLEDTAWSLEVVDSEGNSIVWNDQFATDAAAFAEFQRCVAEEGLVGIVSGRAAMRH